MTDASGIDKLTPKQEKFCLLYIELGNAAEAYRRAYACANMSAATIQREATRLLANPTITTRLLQLRAQVAEKAVLDKAWVLDKIRKNVEVSLGEQTLTLKVQKRDKGSGVVTVSEIEVSAHDAAAANKGLELLARHLGMFVDKHEVTGKDGEPLLPDDKPIDKIDLARRLLHMIKDATDEVAAAQGTNSEEKPDGRTTH
jgi:phage terminase small subunit